MIVNKVDVGWVKLHRKIRKWKYYNKLKYEKVWQTLLLEANYDDQEFEGVTVKRGELVFSYASYMEKLRDCDPKITERGLRTVIKNLEKHKQINRIRFSGRKFSIIKILNYDDYQANRPDEYQKKIEDLEAEIARLKDIIQGNISSKSDRVSDRVSDRQQARKVTGKSQKSDREAETQIPMFKEGQGGSTQKVTGKSQKSDRQQARKVTGKVTGKVTTLKEVKENKEINKEKDFNKICSAKRVIDYLNLKAGKNFKYVDANISLINARFKEGYLVDDFEKAIDNQVECWLGNEREMYLRPKTLFSKQNFDGYVNKKSNKSLEQYFKEQERLILEEESKQKRESNVIDIEEINQGPNYVPW